MEPKRKCQRTIDYFFKRAVDNDRWDDPYEDEAKIVIKYIIEKILTNCIEQIPEASNFTSQAVTPSKRLVPSGCNKIDTIIQMPILDPFLVKGIEWSPEGKPKLTRLELTAFQNEGYDVRKHRVWQLHCQIVGNPIKANMANNVYRKIIFTGATSLFDLCKTILRAFCWDLDDFKYKAGQGKITKGTTVRFPYLGTYCVPEGCVLRQQCNSNSKWFPFPDVVMDKAVHMKSLKVGEVLVANHKYSGRFAEVFVYGRKGCAGNIVQITVDGITPPVHKMSAEQTCLITGRYPTCVGGAGMPSGSLESMQPCTLRDYQAELNKGWPFLPEEERTWNFNVRYLNRCLMAGRAQKGCLMLDDTPQHVVENVFEGFNLNPIFDIDGNALERGGYVFN